jgi:hypothetical protein
MYFTYMHRPVQAFRRVLFSVLTRPVHSVLLIHPFNLDSIKPSWGRLMSVAQVLLALQVPLGQQEDPKGLKAFQVLQDRREQLEQQGHEACKASRVSQGLQEQQGHRVQEEQGQQDHKGQQDQQDLRDLLGVLESQWEVRSLELALITIFFIAVAIRSNVVKALDHTI